MSFCKETSLHPLPASEEQLCLFVSSLANQRLCHNTNKCYLSAVRHLHIAEGFGDPHISSMARLEQVLRGVKAVQAKVRKSPQRLPITPELLAKLRAAWMDVEGGIDWSMLWAAASLCFFGFLRSGEITAQSEAEYDEGANLSFSDVATDSISNPQVLRIRIKASKTGPFREGVDVFVSKSGNALCPVTAVLAYMVRRGAGPGPFFRFANGCPLSRERLVREVKKALSRAGVDCARYSGHSFRSGAATTAARRGLNDATIKMLGRWKSSAYQLYIKTPRDELAAFSRQLAGGGGH